jgi:ribose transport system ATP-binding protein
MEEPTAGVDIGAKTLIHHMLRKIAAGGAAILVVSSDFEEVASLCDRALVVTRGKITADLSGAALTLDGLISRSSVSAATPSVLH